VFARSGGYFQRGMLAFGAVGLVCVIGFAARGLWVWGLASAAFFGFFALGMRRTAGKHSGDSPVLAALLERPETVTTVRYQLVPGRGVVPAQHFLRVTLQGGQVAGLKVSPAEIVPVGKVLKDRCSAATFQVPGL
jgi:hypothetical protein